MTPLAVCRATTESQCGGAPQGAAALPAKARSQTSEINVNCLF
ncbi:hypothetical protein [Polaromonas sp. CG9_12]|nr:hypothetical protein [Polaromonas sp. CG9_12]